MYWSDTMWKITNNDPHINKRYNYLSEYSDKVFNTSKVSAKSQSLKITYIYFITGCLWVLVSDKLVGFLVKNHSAIIVISILKGWFYVFFTSVLIFLLVFSALKKVIDSEDKIRKMNIELEKIVLKRTYQLEEINAELEKTNAILEVEIVERQMAEEEIKKMNEEENNYLSYHDVLTGLYNRRYYEEAIERLDTERNLPISIIVADVNGLKLINDAFGHSKGDEFLRKAAIAIQSACRADDIVARWGGDEFIILLPKTKTEEAEEIVKKIKDMYSNEYVNAISVSISFGWDTKRIVDEDIIRVLRSAEDYMYKHKIIENKGMRSSIINTIINTLHEKNPREERHSKRVSEICQSMAKAMGFSEIEVSRLKVVGLLHDIGKIAIEEGILNKPGKLTDQERDEIKRHPNIGYRILSSSHEMLELAECILLHHERWDGTGYPKGLKGESIPRIARIIAIADSFDAMTSQRSYQEALSEEEAIVEIRKNAGSQFDPEVARIFVEKVLNKSWD